MRIRATLLSLAIVPVVIGAAAASAAAPGPLSQAPAATAVRWQIDPAHSELTFRIRHLVSRVSGQFNTWSGTITADPANLAGGSVSVDIQTASIDTNNERRDTHLRSADFFDAATHPTITFRSTRVVANGRNIAVRGNLTLRGVTKPVVLEGQMTEVGGQAGRRRIGFEAETTINRMDYGVAWNRAAEGGGVVLGDEVTIAMAVAAVEQP